MTEQVPFIIQFNHLDDFIADFEFTNEAIVRVWLGEFGSGGDPGVRYHAVMVQASDTAKYTILQASLVVGSYQTMYGNPFGPIEKSCYTLIKEWQDNALARVQIYLEQNLPAGVKLRPGHIYTGLEGPKVSRAYWDGFQTIYDELKQLRRAS